MKRVPKILQADTRGQIVIPKEIRDALNIDQNSGFIAYLIDNEGIFLKKITAQDLSTIPEIKELKDKANAINVQKKNIETAENSYKHKKKGGFADI